MAGLNMFLSGSIPPKTSAGVKPCSAEWGLLLYCPAGGKVQ